MKLLVIVAAIALCAGCTDATGPDWSEFEVYGAVEFEPPAEYVDWARAAIACMGESADAATVVNGLRWYEATSIRPNGSHWTVGLYLPVDEPSVFLLTEVVHSRSAVKHEITHAVMPVADPNHTSPVWRRCET